MRAENLELVRAPLFNLTPSWTTNRLKSREEDAAARAYFFSSFFSSSGFAPSSGLASPSGFASSFGAFA